MHYCILKKKINFTVIHCLRVCLCIVCVRVCECDVSVSKYIRKHIVKHLYMFFDCMQLDILFDFQQFSSFFRLNEFVFYMFFYGHFFIFQMCIYVLWIHCFSSKHCAPTNKYVTIWKYCLYFIIYEYKLIAAYIFMSVSVYVHKYKQSADSRMYVICNICQANCLFICGWFIVQLEQT